jgi:hypothetical protein
MRRKYPDAWAYKADARVLAAEGWRVEFADSDLLNEDWPRDASGREGCVAFEGCLLFLVAPLIVSIAQLVDLFWKRPRRAREAGWTVTYVRNVDPASVPGP